MPMPYEEPLIPQVYPGPPVPPEGIAAPPPGPMAPPPQAMEAQAQQSMPPQTTQDESWWKKLLPAIAPALLAGGGAIVANRNGGKPGAGHDIGAIMGGIAGGFADERHQQGVTKRGQTFKQNEAMLETAHKAVMALQGMDLAKFPALQKLTTKYKEAMASQESDGSYISPKEASELVSLWVVSQGEFGKAQDEKVGSDAAVAGKAGAQRAAGEEQGFNPGMTPDAAMQAVSGRRQAGIDAAAPVSLGSLGIPGMPSGAGGLNVPKADAAKMIMENLQQNSMAARQNAQQAGQFSRQMVMMQKQFEQAQMQQNDMGMRTIFSTALNAATHSDINGDAMFADTPQGRADAADWINDMFTRFASKLAPPPGAGRGRVDPNSIKPVTR